jgi:hypothetical protein
MSNVKSINIEGALMVGVLGETAPLFLRKDSTLVSFRKSYNIPSTVCDEEVRRAALMLIALAAHSVIPYFGLKFQADVHVEKRVKNGHGGITNLHKFTIYGTEAVSDFYLNKLKAALEVFGTVTLWEIGDMEY